MSLSARRAWIEIKIPRAITDTGLVALRKESVDKNIVSYYVVSVKSCRSPQGERG